MRRRAGAFLLIFREKSMYYAENQVVVMKICDMSTDFRKRHHALQMTIVTNDNYQKSVLRYDGIIVYYTIYYIIYNIYLYNEIL